MTTRIPHRKPKLDSKAESSAPTILSPEEVHEALLNLGAPPISQEDLARLYKGRLAEALSAVVEHVRGRQGCALARQAILRSFLFGNYACSVLSIRRTREDKNPARSIVDKANSRLAGTKKALEVSQKQLEEKICMLKSSGTLFYDHLLYRLYAYVVQRTNFAVSEQV
jgi:hypothetical protein